jgi:isopenicillin-N N-acyltransferase-like protein
MTLLKRLDNLDILCDDADALAHFYHDVLGLPFLLPYEPGEGWFCVQAGDTTIYVFEGNGDPHHPRRTPVNAENPPGFDSIAFAVDDLDEAIAEYDGRLDWAAEPIVWEHPSGTWYRFRPFYDPEGNMMYLTQPKNKPAV